MDVSILLSLSHRLDLIRACLESLERTAGRVRYEVIFIDERGSAATRDFLQTLSGAGSRALLNDPARGYAGNLNAAAKLARAPVLCLLRSDTVLMPGWLEPMLRVLRRGAEAGCVGNVQREPFSGLIDHIGISFAADGWPTQAGKNEAVPPPGEYARWPVVSAVCQVIRQEVFTSLGGFDEGFQLGWAEVDFCLRAAEAGYRHYVANRSIIYHYVGASLLEPALEERNRERYRSRWGARFLAFAAQRAGQRSAVAHHPVFSPENESAWREQWELGRRARQQHRQDIIDARFDGRRYLRKHAARPWRYNFGRVSRALVQAAHPLPAALPPPPPYPAHHPAETAGPQAAARDWELFDPSQP